MSTPPENLSEIQTLGNGSGFGVVTYPPGGTHGPRIQQHYQLVVIHRGSAVVTSEEMTVVVNAGEGILLPPGRRESFAFSEATPTTHSWGVIPPSDLPATLTPPEGALLRALPCSGWLLEWMREGWQTLRATHPSPELMTSAVLMAFWDFCHHEALAPKERRQPEALLRARRCMEERMSEPLSLAEIAAQAGVSRGHLSELTRHYWGSSPMAFLWELRVRRGAELLRETGRSVAEIAYQLGFTNPFHFSRRFRRHYGVDPRSWRRQAWAVKEA